MTVVSLPAIDDHLDGYSFTDAAPPLDPGEKFVTLTVRLTNAGSGQEPVPVNAAGLADLPFRITIPNSAHDSLAPDQQWTNSWASCLTRACSGYLDLASTDPASTNFDFLGDNRPQLEVGQSVTMVMYVEVPAGFEKVLDQVQLFWFGVNGSGMQEAIPLAKS